MTDIKHTPGPWEVESPDPMCNYAIEIHTTDPNRTGTGWIASVHQQFSSLENGLANSRLIASAPEMYELLKSMAIDPDYLCSKTPIKKLLDKIDNP